MTRDVFQVDRLVAASAEGMVWLRLTGRQTGRQTDRLVARAYWSFVG